MNKARRIIGCHARFFPDGKAYTLPNPGGNAGREVKPGADDPAWLDVGIADWTIAPQHTLVDFKAPSPGARMLYDKLATSRGLKLKGKWMEMSNLIYRMLLATAAALPLTGVGGQFNPLAGDPVVRGWLQLQEYDQTNTLINTTDYFVALTIPGDVEFGENPVDVQVEADVLFSTKMTGTLA